MRMLPSRPVTALDSAISRAQAFLLGAQAADGHWVGQLEANTTITSEYLLLCHLIDRVSKERERKAVRYFRSRQRADGGFTLYTAKDGDRTAVLLAEHT